MSTIAIRTQYHSAIEITLETFSKCCQNKKILFAFQRNENESGERVRKAERTPKCIPMQTNAQTIFVNVKYLQVMQREEQRIHFKNDIYEKVMAVCACVWCGC